ncbi:hypothetical protein J2Z83_002433 [Virgibacillus natechei]|uniref:Uncharacterized protein n=1 Tax=Virgibacillus natechei TaxID=1216297 RepID=A0ABS4IH88_9BACI|nr:hypothetical protein [Virgibacillus natechei]MBP1970315.1 hypothetical protein [Virgibacillus natechei]UZD13143.1 hypothetical protein OLD84_00765 [Virgibacillus natechei]
MIDLLWGNAILAAGLLAFCLIFVQVSIFIVIKYKSASIPDIQILKKAHKRTLFIREKKLVPILATFVAVVCIFLCMVITEQTLPEEPSLHRLIVILIIILSLNEFSSASSLLIAAFLLLNDGESIHKIWRKASLLCGVIGVFLGLLYFATSDINYLLALISFLLGGLGHFANSWRFNLPNTK